MSHAGMPVNTKRKSAACFFLKRVFRFRRPPLWSSGQSFCYRSGGPGSIPGTTKKKVVGLERGPLSLVSTTEETLDRKVAAPV
jgi:hypothetical protein